MLFWFDVYVIWNITVDHARSCWFLITRVNVFSSVHFMIRISSEKLRNIFISYISLIFNWTLGMPSIRYGTFLLALIFCHNFIYFWHQNVSIDTYYIYNFNKSWRQYLKHSLLCYDYNTKNIRHILSLPIQKPGQLNYSGLIYIIINFSRS